MPTLSRRHIAFALASLAVVAVVATMPQLLGDQVREGIDGVGEANRAWLWISGLGFALSLAASGCAWRSALGRCGGDTSRLDAAARYGMGSLANAFAPAKLGTALRIVLFSRVLHGEGRIWTSGGIGTSVGVAHWVWLAAMLTFGAATGALPAYPIAIVAAVAAVAIATAYLARNSRRGGRIAHLFDAFRMFGRCPRAAGQMLGWIGLATLGRIAAATAIASAFGIENPLLAAMLVVPALELAGTLPLTPGNIGVASAAAAFALKAHGVGADVAVSAGIAFGAVETITSIAFGAGSVLYLAGAVAPGAPSARRWVTAAVSATGCLALAAAFGATVLFPVV
jgi:uncharacterized membrane protein YbhN (UPF0104 family)